MLRKSLTSFSLVGFVVSVQLMMFSFFMPQDAYTTAAGMWWLSHLSLLLTLAFAILLTPALIRWTRHAREYRRRDIGLCVNCGYNLEGLTEPRCPECNTPFDNS